MDRNEQQRPDRALFRILESVVPFQEQRTLHCWTFLRSML